MPRSPDSFVPCGSLEWLQLLELARQRLRARLRDWPMQDIDDLAQDVMANTLDFVRRNGPPRSPEGLVSVIARRRAADAIQDEEMARHREISLDSVTPTLEGPLSESELAEILEEQAWTAFVVSAFFRSAAAHRECMAIAEAKRDGIDLRQFAEVRGQSHDAVRQRWSRCLDSLEEAITRGDLRIDWRLVRRRKSA